MPGVVQNPGRNAGNMGNNVQMGRLHYTVGVDSTGIGVNGYFHFLIPKEGTPQQFAPTEAVCWDACEWNPTGVGIEFERLSDAEPLTANQLNWGGLIVRWLSAEHGIPLVFRDTPEDRMPVGTSFQGFTTHRSLHENACDEHYDYITQSDWAAMLGGAIPSALMEDFMYALKAAPGTPQAGYVALVGETHVDGFLESNMNLAGVTVVQAANQQDWDATIAKRVSSPTGPAGTVTVVIDYDKLGAAITAGIKGL